MTSPLPRLRTTAPLPAARPLVALALALTAVALAPTRALAQVPEAVAAEGWTPLTTPGDDGAKLVPCALNDAGSAIPGAATAMSNDLTFDTVYLCFGDELLIDHNGDQRLGGDPDPSTPGGVGYAWYECRPTIDGPTLGAVAADRCLIDNPGAPPGSPPFFVSTGGRRDGDVLFFNQGAVQTQFNGGNPYLVWFAPITFDRLEVSGTTSNPRYESGGACVSVSTDAAFAVVYLNEIRTSELSLTNCGGQFRITGGLPGYRSAANYQFEVVNTADPTIRGTVTTPFVTSGGIVRFSVPQAGSYQIRIRDGKACSAATLVANVTACDSPGKITLTVDTIRGAPGSTVCVPLRANGFRGVNNFQFGLRFDQALLRFDRFQNVSISPFSQNSEYRVNGNQIIVINPFLGAGPRFNFADGEILFELCFEVLGVEGEFGVVDYTPPLSGYEFGTDDAFYEYCLNPGGVAITSSPIAVLAGQETFGCGGDNANAFVVRALGGTAPYQVSWQRVGGGAVQGPATITRDNRPFVSPTSLAPGTYDITVRDAAGITVVRRITLADGPALGVIIERVSDLRCNGDQIGALKAVPTLDFTEVDNPDNTYTYRWSTGATTQSINGLGTGSYTVTVTDGRGCMASVSNSITAPPRLMLDVTVTDATCVGLRDGAISVMPTGGTSSMGSYDFRITGPSGAVNNAASARLDVNGDPGVYGIVVTDANGCTADATATVGAQRVLSTSPVIDSISCNGANDGQIVLTVGASLGTANPPFTFAWTGVPAGSVSSTNTVSTVSGLGQGMYRVIARDADGCEVRDDFELTEPNALTLALVSSTDETCDPGSDGTAEVRAAGGVTDPRYTYTWTDAAGATVATGPRATGLVAGTYTPVVTDRNGCTATLATPVTIVAPPRPTIDRLDDSSVSCATDTDGVLEVEASAGGAPIVGYRWSNGATTPRVDGLAPGTYTVEIRDGDGCVTTGEATVNAPDPLSVSDSTLVGPSCFQQGGGLIDVTIAGGTGPYTFTWSDGTTGVGASRISGPAITAGGYTLEVVDANGCPPLRRTYVLDDAPSIDPDFTDFQRASCAIEVCDGGVSVTAMLPGTPGATFDFVWESGETTDAAVSSRAIALCGGRNVVTIQETSRACPPQEFTIDIPAPDPIAVQVGTVEDARCFGESTGSITLDDVVGGTPGYTFAWTSSAGTQTGRTAIDLPAGIVELEIRDSDGCPYRDQFIISEPPLLTLAIDGDGTADPSCNGETDGRINLLVAGGNPGGGQTIRWSDDPSRNSVQASNLPAGTYTAQVTDRKGCTAEIEVTLVEPDAITFTFEPFAELACFGDLADLRIATVAGGNGMAPEDYQISVGGSSFQTVDQVFQVPGGTPLPVTVVDPTGCIGADEVLVPSPPAITVRLPETVEVELGDSVRLRPSIFPGGAPIVFDSIRWSPDSTLSFAAGNRTDPYAGPLATTTYTIFVSDESGCTQTASVVVEVDRNRNVYIPNAFSPNGDATNDEWQIYTGPGVRSIDFVQVFSRWGELMYEATDVPLNPFGQAPGWDGTFRGRIVEVGTYVYIASVTFLDDRVLIYKGDVNVVY